MHGLLEGMLFDLLAKLGFKLFRFTPFLFWGCPTGEKCVQKEHFSQVELDCMPKKAKMNEQHMS